MELLLHHIANKLGPSQVSRVIVDEIAWMEKRPR